MKRSGFIILAVTACGGHAAPGTTQASTTYVQPQPGETHLRNIRQLTFGGNNAESYFNSKGTQLIFFARKRSTAPAIRNTS